MKEEEKERLRVIEKRDILAFPALPVKHNEDNSVENIETKEEKMSFTWKDLFQRQTNKVNSINIESLPQANIFHADFPSVKLTSNLRKNFVFEEDTIITFGSFDNEIL